MPWWSPSPLLARSIGQFVRQRWEPGGTSTISCDESMSVNSNIKCRMALLAQFCQDQIAPCACSLPQRFSRWHLGDFVTGNWNVIRSRPVRKSSLAAWPPVLGMPSEVTQLDARAPEWYTEEKSRLCIVDAMGLIYKAHFGYKGDRLRSFSNEDTTIIYSFLQSLIAILDMYPRPTHLVVVFDAPGANFRMQLYPAYKAQRPETPDEIRVAVPKVIELLETMNVKVVQSFGVEADDVCGTLSERARIEGMMAFIFTSDKDFFQLLQDDVLIFLGPTRGEYLVHTSTTFSEIYGGLVPHQFIEVRALCGDTSDNIPGVAGVGEKTALKLIKEYGTVEGVIDAVKSEAVKRSKRCSQLSTELGWKMARKSRELVEIQTNLGTPDMRFSLDECKLGPLADNGTAFFERLNHYDIIEPADRLTSILQRWKDSE